MTDNSTLDFYNQCADAYIERTRNVKLDALYNKFNSHLPTHLEVPHHILDVGCGSGRDSFWFSNKLGMDVIAIDGSSELIKRNQAYYATSNSNVDWRYLKFEDIKHQGWQNQFTGIWACASLLHVPFIELPEIIMGLMDTLISGGVMYASFKYGDSERWDGNRFFCDMNEDRFIEVLQQINLPYSLNFEARVTADQQGRRDVEWFNVLLRKR